MSLKLAPDGKSKFFYIAYFHFLLFSTFVCFCRVSKVRLQRTAGAFIPLNDVRAESVAAHWEKINKFDENSDYPDTTGSSMASLMANLENVGASNSAASGGGSATAASGKGVAVDGFKASALFTHLSEVLAKEGEGLRYQVE